MTVVGQYTSVKLEAEALRNDPCSQTARLTHATSPGQWGCGVGDPPWRGPNPHGHPDPTLLGAGLTPNCTVQAPPWAHHGWTDRGRGPSRWATAEALGL